MDIDKIKKLKIHYAHNADCMRKFEFNKMFKLRPFSTRTLPTVVFGCYHKKDYELIKNHKGIIVVVWCGRDTHSNMFIDKPNVVHTTWLPHVRKYLIDRGVNCHLLKIPSREKPTPIVRGDKVYAYLSKDNPQYHGSDIVEQLNLNGKLLIGDNTVSRYTWYRGEANKFYSQAYIGLMLSSYTGGGFSILEMGLRGIRVVTNVIDLPNTIRWETVSDVQTAIDNEAKNAWSTDTDLANAVYEATAHDFDSFDLSKLWIE